MFLLWLLAASIAARSSQEELVDCMTDDYTTSTFVTQGVSWLGASNPGLTESDGWLGNTKQMAETLWEFEGMWNAITECAKAGDMTPITSGSFTWWAPNGRPFYNIYTQKQGNIEEIGSFKERVLVVGDWARRVEQGRFTCNLSQEANNKFLSLMNKAYDLWQKEFDYYPTSLPEPTPSSEAAVGSGCSQYGDWRECIKHKGECRWDLTNGGFENGQCVPAAVVDCEKYNGNWHACENQAQCVYDSAFDKCDRKNTDLSSSIASTKSTTPTTPAVVQVFAALGVAFLCYGSFRYYVK